MSELYSRRTGRLYKARLDAYRLLQNRSRCGFRVVRSTFKSLKPALFGFLSLKFLRISLSRYGRFKIECLLPDGQFSINSSEKCSYLT